MSDAPRSASDFGDGRRKRPLFLLLGCAAAVLGFLVIGVERTSDPGRGPDTVKVLVARKDLSVNTTFDSKELDNLLTWADIPRGLVPADAVASLDDVKDKSLNRTLRTGQPVAYSDLGIGCTYSLPDGFRQITFRSSQVDAVAGFVRPGSKVDVMFVERTAAGKSRAGIILKNVLVLAVNMTDRPRDWQGPAIPRVESVSLAVTDNQARMLGPAEDKGKLKLVPPGNDKKSNTTIAKSAAGGHEIECFDDES